MILLMSFMRELRHASPIIGMPTQYTRRAPPLSMAPIMSDTRFSWAVFHLEVPYEIHVPSSHTDCVSLVPIIMTTALGRAVVMMMGTNDTQSVWDDGTWLSYGTSKWASAGPSIGRADGRARRHSARGSAPSRRPGW